MKNEIKLVRDGGEWIGVFKVVEKDNGSMYYGFDAGYLTPESVPSGDEMPLTPKTVSRFYSDLREFFQVFNVDWQDGGGLDFYKSACGRLGVVADEQSFDEMAFEIASTALEGTKYHIGSMWGRVDIGLSEKGILLARATITRESGALKSKYFVLNEDVRAEFERVVEGVKDKINAALDKSGGV